MLQRKLEKKLKKIWLLENNVFKNSLPLQRFNKAIDCIKFLKVKENEEISFDGCCYCSCIFRLLW